MLLNFVEFEGVVLSLYEPSDIYFVKSNLCLYMLKKSFVLDLLRSEISFVWGDKVSL